MQLPVADVDRDHTCGASLQQHVREAARRRADVDRVESPRVDAERVETVRELVAAARNVRRPARDGEVCILVDLLAGLVVAGNLPGHHERLRLRARFRKPALHEDDVEALLHAVRTASPSTISRRTLVSASTASRRSRARSAALSACWRAPSTPCVTT